MAIQYQSSLLVMLVVLRLATVVLLILVEILLRFLLLLILLRSLLLMTTLRLALLLLLLGLDLVLLLLRLLLLLLLLLGSTSVGALLRRLLGLVVLATSMLLVLLDQVLKVQLLFIIILILLGVVGQDVIGIKLIFIIVILLIFVLIRLGLGRGSLLGLLNRLLGLFSGLSGGSCGLGGSSRSGLLGRWLNLFGLGCGDLILRLVLVLIFALFILVVIFLIVFVAVTFSGSDDVLHGVGLGHLKTLVKLLANLDILIRDFLLVNIFIFFTVHEHALIVTFTLRLEEATEVKFGALDSADGEDDLLGDVHVEIEGDTLNLILLEGCNCEILKIGTHGSKQVDLASGGILWEGHITDVENRVVIILQDRLGLVGFAVF